MANIKSAAKRLRQSLRRAARNQAAKTRVRRVIKEVRTLLARGNAAAAAPALQAAVSVLDKTASKGILHPRTVARYKSRLASQLHAKTRTAR
ncbi:MAG: 30S ribosomal protein S20 [Candidatus Methylomirabilales bacterium]